MAPPGRRRRTASHSSLLLLLLLCVLASTAYAASGVLGIDLGSEYIKAVLVKPGIPLEIVLTKDSKRKEAATVAFKPSPLPGSEGKALPERLYGGDANALAARYPGDVYQNLKVLLGAEVGSPAVDEYGKRYTGLVAESVMRNESSGAGTVGFKSQSWDSGERPLMVEELLAMQLKNIRMNAAAAAGGRVEITDVVLTVPAFYTAEEKRALQLAADLAGLRVLALISDGLAVGLNYATSRTFPSISDGAKAEYHLVYDMGAGSTTATVLRFQGRTVKDVGKRNRTIQEVQVMSTRWRKDLGGDAWNQVIVEDMVARLAEAPKIKSQGVLPEQIKKNGKAMARLWKEAERMRQVLSANSHTSATLEGLLLEEVVFKYKLSRAEFESLTASSASQVSLPLIDALDAADMTMSSLDSVILHGGAVRTPFVQKHLEAVAGASSKIRTNVNADEAAVLGAAFKAAGLSPSFRVKDIRADDMSGFVVRLRWTADGRERTRRLFTARSAIGAEKLVSFSAQEDFVLEISQTVNDDGHEFDVPVSEVTMLNLTASAARLKDKYPCAPANISTKLSMRLSPLDGLPEVVSGSIGCEAEAEASKEGGVMDNVRGLFGFGSKKAQDQEGLHGGNESQDETASSTSSSATGSASASTTPSTMSSPSGPSTTNINMPISFSARPLGRNSPLPAGHLVQIRDRLGRLDASDRARALRAEAVNSLESFTYRGRDHLSDPSFITYSPPTIRDRLERQLSETSEWLYGDGVDAPRADFQQRLKDLQGLVEPVLGRRDEASKREVAVQRLQDKLGRMKGVIEGVEQSLQKAAAESAAATTGAAAATESAARAETDDNDEDQDLDSNPYSSSTSSASASTSTTAAQFQPSDLRSLQSSHSSITTWLTDQLAQQSVLEPAQDPVLSIRHLDDKLAEAEDVIGRVLAGKKKKEEEEEKKEKKKEKEKEKEESKRKKGNKRKGKGTASSSHEQGKDGKDGKEGLDLETAPDMPSSSGSDGHNSGGGNGRIRDEL